jgi:hypothetical protein
MRDKYGIKAKPTYKLQLYVTTIHAQANAIIEQVHKVINNMQRLFDLENKINHENLED